jgi:hypothetical protein
MTDTTPHRATPDQWADILELRARIEALEAGATCPHIVTGDEGTSYCRLAEQQAAPPPEPTPTGSMVVRVGRAIANADEECLADSWAPEARAAIRAMAAAARSRDLGGQSVPFMSWDGVAQWLEQEAER